MTVIDNRSPNRNYTLPNGANALADDVLRLRSAAIAIDSDVATLLAGLALKANLVHGHTIADITGLQAALDAKTDNGSGGVAYAPLDSPNLTGTPTAPTRTLGDNSTKIATTGFVAGSLALGLATKANVVHGHAAGEISGLSPVATSGAYSDLSGKPPLGTSAQRDSANVADIRQNNANRVIETDEAWASIATVTLTDTATIDANFNNFINAKVTLAGNRVINFSNGFDGKSGRIQIIQDGTGNRTLSFTAGQCVFAGGTAPTLSTAGGARDTLYYDILDDGKVFVSLNKALS